MTDVVDQPRPMESELKYRMSDVATGELRWLEDARRLALIAVELFADDEHGGFFLTPTHGEQLVARQGRAAMFDEVPEQLELARGQIHGLAGAGNFHAPEVDVHVAEAVRVAAWRRGRRAASQ